MIAYTTPSIGRSRTGLIGLAALGLVAATPPHAVAQPSAEDRTVEEAAQHYERGEAAYNLGHYDEAITEWEASYKLSKEPLLLFNLGQAARLDGDCERALGYYKAYLREAPGAEHEDEARGFITEMEDCVAEKPPVEPPKPQPDEKPVTPPTEEPVTPPVVEESGTRPGRGKKLVGVSLVGVGALLAGTGAYFGLKASASADDVTEACDGGCEWSDVESKENTGERAETLQWIFYGAGAAAVVSGAVLYYLGARERSNPSTQVTVTPHAGGMVFSLGGAW